MDGYCGIHPYATWNDTDVPGVALAIEMFEAAGRPEEDRSSTYLTTFGQFMGVREALIHTVNTNGSADITGEQFLNALIDLGGVDGMGMSRSYCWGHTAWFSYPPSGLLVGRCGRQLELRHRL